MRPSGGMTPNEPTLKEFRQMRDKDTTKHGNGFIDRTGEVFRRLTVLGPSKERSRDNRFQWECRCECGKALAVATHALISGNTKSCGCLKLDQFTARVTKHGMTTSREWASWMAAKMRCTNPKNNAYANYAGRGITMCERWLHSFENFYADMGPKPSPAHSIDRINNDGNYEPGNCRWATTKEQRNNTRQCKPLTLNGVTLPANEWSRRLGLHENAVYLRLARGWTLEEALTIPRQTHGWRTRGVDVKPRPRM